MSKWTDNQEHRCKTCRWARSDTGRSENFIVCIHANRRGNHNYPYDLDTVCSEWTEDDE